MHLDYQYLPTPEDKVVLSVNGQAHIPIPAHQACLSLNKMMALETAVAKVVRYAYPNGLVNEKIDGPTEWFELLYELKLALHSDRESYGKKQ